MSRPTHNLDIQTYSLEELLGLFGLTTYNISTNDLRQAKKRVLMLHPDKSKLESKYFLFYKKAFDVIVQFYDNQNRQHKQVDGKELVYRPTEDNDTSTSDNINKQINEISNSDFQDKFNRLFESNNMGNRPDTTQNEWFKQEENDFNIPEGKISRSEMGDAFNRVKHQSNSLIKYNGVQEMLHTTSAGNSSLYEDNDQYVSCDPFGKLQYDDLRKVHRDQTVLAVSEHDFDQSKTYKSVDEFNRARSQYSYDPLEKEKATTMLQEQERIMNEQMMQKEYKSKLQTQQYAEKNKTVLASFLQLKNGK
mgnify:FL=1|tara:strand:- start:1880 stop:2797 length:918 start_codon:yes stop_codon:yes gene_type:complete